ncbi:MAG: shikimate dehydrogenase [Simkaniaceae bacterium]
MLTVVVQGSFEEARKTIQAAQKDAEGIEFRIDLFEKKDPTHVGKLLHLSKVPVIFTLRRKDQGGEFRGNEREREGALLELLKLKPTYVDLEYDVSFRDQIPQDVKVIASYHNFEKTPEDLSTLYKNMQALNATIYKLATHAQSSLDALRMLLFVNEHADVAGMCMGEKGMITRILAPIVGNALTYAPLSKEGGTAPGQVSLPNLREIYHFEKLNRQTKIYALIGNPVDKSIGHLCHNQVFRSLKEDAVYVKIPLTPQEVPLFFKLMKKLPFEGFSVTMPLKEQMALHLDALDPKAKQIGAINTLVKREGKWWGYNTDAGGALDAIERKGSVSGKTLLIIGAGGAAKAIAYEGLQRGGRIIIANRTMKKGEILAKEVKGKGIGIPSIASETYDILINTTSVGMAPDLSAIPVPPEAIHENALVFDAIFNPKETRLLNIAKNKGCPTVCGYEMYAYQAFKQFELWLDRPLDRLKIFQIIESYVI